MSNPRALEDLAEDCFQAGHAGATVMADGEAYSLCLPCARAYAEQVRWAEREAMARIGDERAKEFEQKRATHHMDEEELWWRARKVEAQDYAAIIRGRET